MSQSAKSFSDSDVAELKETLKCYALERHEPDLREILQQEDADEHYSVIVNALSLFESCVTICYTLCTSPLLLLPVFNSALRDAQTVIYDQDKNKNDLSVKRNVHARITSLPVQQEFTRVTVPKTSDVGNFLALTGTVIRSTVVRVLEYEKDFICNKCKTALTQKADLVQYSSIGKPTKCSNDVCNSTNFTFVAEKGGQPVKCQNYQEVKIQEQVQRLTMGTIPRSIWIVLQDDIVDCCKAGDDVIVCGTVLRRWRNVSAENKCDIELFIKANSIIVTNEQKNSVVVTQELKDEIQKFWEDHESTPLTGRNHILACLCPQVYGLYVVKLAVAMVLAGGVQRQDNSGTCVRGEIHMLLVGDPGTGKSQFLKYASKITPRSVLTTGIGSTSAGLTVTAVKDGGEWQLEAGALVLSDGGLCCIDEFNSIREHDKASIHEAMEQQTISVAKAGMVCKLNTKTTILAATNPKGQYDPNESLSVNIALASPLLSRFDLVLVLLDTQNEDWDRVVSGYILEGKHPVDPDDKRSVIWSMDKMQAYISLIKTINPERTPGAMSVLRQYYHAQRGSDDRNAARTTMRLLQSMIRLSQAHARLMFRDKVTIQDAVVAVTMMESSMQGAALLGGVNALHTAFPDDAEEEYKIQAEMILERLNLPDLLENERQRVNDVESSANPDVLPVHSTSAVAPAQSTSDMSSASSSSLHSSVEKYDNISGVKVELNSVGSENNDSANQVSSSKDIVNESNDGKSNDKHQTEQLNGATRAPNTLVGPLDVSLTDMLNFSDEENVSIVNHVSEFPQVGASGGGFISQSSVSSTLPSDNGNFKILPTSTSTPFGKHSALNDKKIPEEEKNTDKGNAKRTLIQRTIDNRLSQVPKNDSSDLDKGVEYNEKLEKDFEEESRAKLVCVKTRKSKDIGESSSTTGHMKKQVNRYMNSIVRNKVDTDKEQEEANVEINSLDRNCNSKVTVNDKDSVSAKRKSKKRAIMSDSDDEFETNDDSKYDRKHKRTLGKNKTDIQSATGCDYKTPDSENLTSAKSSKVSLKTLSKLSKFQFDESNRSVSLSTSGFDTSLSTSTLSDSMWTNEESGEKIKTGKSKPVCDGVKTDVELQNITNAKSASTNSVREVIDDTQHIRNDNNQHLKPPADSQLNKSKKTSPLNMKSPSWLVTLKKKFSSPNITSSVGQAPSTPVFSVNDNKSEDLDIDDL